MKRTITKTLIMILLIAFAIVIVPIKSNAGYQASKGGTRLTNLSANDFFVGIRNMEKSGGTLGLEATLEETTYKDTSKNGLDCHMAKNTEWGTAAMLSASIYGIPPERQSDASTTGNESGIYQMAKGNEYVAGIWDTTSYIDVIRGADARYYDLYTSSTSKPGDATTETQGWHGAMTYGFVNVGGCIFLRAVDSMFGYSNNQGGAYAPNGCRAVVVCGEDL